MAANKPGSTNGLEKAFVNIWLTSHGGEDYSSGLGLMVLPTLIVGNELSILGRVGTAGGGWFLAHRDGCLQGFVDPTKIPLMTGWKEAAREPF